MTPRASVAEVDALVKCGRIRLAGPALVVEDDAAAVQGWVLPEDLEQILLGGAGRIYLLGDDEPIPVGHLVETPAGRSISVVLAGRHYLAIASQVRSAIRCRHAAALFRAHEPTPPPGIRA